MSQHVCTKCGQTKAFSDFAIRTTRKSGRTSWCRRCRSDAAKSWRSRISASKKSEMYRRDNLRKVHGVTVDFYASLLKSQGGCCAICGAVPPNDTHLHIDHNHESGQIRGLLCSKCNTGIGLFDESSERMKAAMGYLALYARAEKAA